MYYRNVLKYSDRCIADQGLSFGNSYCYMHFIDVGTIVSNDLKYSDRRIADQGLSFGNSYCHMAFYVKSTIVIILNIQTGV